MTIAGNSFCALKKHWGFCSAACIALIAFLLRYWFYVRYPYPLMLHEQDGIAYMWNARDILSFKSPGNLFMPPFYSIIIAFFSLLPIKMESAARIASITMDALVVLPLFGLARIFLPCIASLTVCGLWATFSFSLINAPSPLSQSTYLFMLLCGTYFLYLAATNDSGVRLYIASGICLCAAYQTRPEGIVALGAGLMVVAICFLRDGIDRRRQAKGAAAFAVAFALCALPYILLLHAQLGYWTFTAKTTVAIKGIDGSLTLGNGFGKAKNGLDLWLEQFGGISGGIKFVSANMAAFFTLLLGTFSPWTHLFSLLGLLFMFIGRNLIQRLFILIPFLVTLPVYVANLPKNHSYIYPLFPLYLLAFVAGLWGVLSLAAKGGKRLLPALPDRILPVVISLVLLGPASSVALSFWRDANANYNASDYLYQVYITDKIFRAAGEELKNISAPEELVMTRWGLISYFAERPLLVLPKGNIDEVLAHGRKNGARLLVIDTESVGTRRQELLELLNPLYGGGIDQRRRLQVVAVRMSDVGGYVIYRFMQ